MLRGDRGEVGAAAVELALVLPLLVMLVFGIIEFGRAFYTKTQLSGAVREGARARALGADATTTEAAVAAAAPGANNGSLVVDAGTVCPSSGPGDATVTATYDLGYTIPFVATGTWNLTVTGVMRCGL